MLIIASALVSGSVLLATNSNLSKNMTLASGALSVLVVVPTSIQTTFKLGARGELHRSAAAGFGRNERELEISSIARTLTSAQPGMSP